jgi:hypothetical protein
MWPAADPRAVLQIPHRALEYWRALHKDDEIGRAIRFVPAAPSARDLRSAIR